MAMRAGRAKGPGSALVACAGPARQQGARSARKLPSLELSVLEGHIHLGAQPNSSVPGVHLSRPSSAALVPAPAGAKAVEKPGSFMCKGL